MYTTSLEGMSEMTAYREKNWVLEGKAFCGLLIFNHVNILPINV